MLNLFICVKIHSIWVNIAHLVDNRIERRYIKTTSKSEQISSKRQMSRVYHCYGVKFTDVVDKSVETHIWELSLNLSRFSSI